ncbi:MAG: hypothetical protein E7167_02715 [Firmicutes bacterium]|nr:hypothetical protein [Bacillota bacterium]
MGVDEIITLEDGKEYILLLESIQDGEKYFLAVEAVDNAPTENFEIFKEIIIDGELSVEEVIDEELRTKLIDDLENQYDEMDTEE